MEVRKYIMHVLKKLISGIMIIVLVSTLINIGSYKTSVKAAGSPKISWFGLDHDLYSGDKETFYVVSKNADKVQYRLWCLSYNTNKWEEITNGYTSLANGNSIYTIKSDKVFTTGRYRFVIWVRDSNSSCSENDCDDYLYTERVVQNDKVQASGTLNNVKNTYSVGETISVNGISNLKGGNGQYLYEVFPYNVDTDSWIDTGTTEFAASASWTPQQPGNYILDVVVKATDSTESYDAYVLQSVKVIGANIASVDDINISTKLGSTANIPKVVQAKYDDGSTRNVTVSWDKIDGSIYSKLGSYTVTGTVTGTNIKANCNISVEANDNLAHIKWIGRENDFVNGGTEGIYIVSQANEKVQYRVWYCDNNTGKWYELTNGYTTPTDGKVPYRVTSSQTYTAGNYRFVVWAKTQSSKNSLDDYKYIDVRCADSGKYADGNVNIAKDTYSIGETVVVNGISSIKGAQGQYVYKIYAYNTDNDSWITDGSGYSTNPKWAPQQPGNYILDIWAKPQNSSVDCEVYKLKAIKVVQNKIVLSAPDINIDCFKGEAPVLPSNAMVKMSDGTTQLLSVTWDPISPNQYANIGQTILSGTIIGTSLKIKAVITVKDPNGIAQVTYYNVSHNIVSGQTGGFLIKGNGAQKIQYRVWYYDINEDKWGEITNGYSAPVDSNDLYTIESTNKFHAGQYKIVVWAKGENSSKEEDSYSVYYANCSQGTVHVNGDMNVSNSHYKVGDMINVNGVNDINLNGNASSANPSDCLYKLFVYDATRDQWISTSDYTGNPTWIPKQTGNYLLLTWIKPIGSNSEVDNYKMCSVNVVESNQYFSYADYPITLSSMLNMEMKDSPQDDPAGSWVDAEQKNVLYYLNPKNFENDPYGKYMFYKLNYASGANTSELSSVLKGQGILSGREAAFIQGAHDYNVSPIYLVAHSMLETGRGTSVLANGVNVNGKYYYNMYGIAAYDSDPVYYGSQYAAKMGWDTPEKAIIGGAKWISDNYINNQNYDQNTLYKMRWNIYGHQYATDIGWAYKQTFLIRKIADQLPSLALYFEIPKYKE